MAIGTSSCPIVIEDSPKRSPIKLSKRAEVYRHILEDSDVGIKYESDLSIEGDVVIEDDNNFEEGVVIAEDNMRYDKEPIFELPPAKYTAERVVKILLDPQIDLTKVCKQCPIRVEKSGTYVVDLDSLQDPADVKKDSFGVWKHSGSHDLKFESRITGDGVLEIGKGVFSSSEGWEQFSLRRLHSIHPTNSKFRRMLAFITDGKGNPHHLCLVVYHIPPGFKPEVKPHGNAKSDKPYYPTWPSTMKLMKKKIGESGPKDIVASVSAKVGGVMGATAPGQLPRGEMQVSNAKRSIKFQGSQGDELYVMMQQSKSGDNFVRDIKIAPDPAIVVACDRQLDDLVRFCATPAGVESSILTVDPTFCLGDFECTPTTYRHLLLTTRRYGSSPVFVGPVLIHYRKNFASFHFFAASLVALRRSLEGLRFFGTDGEKALIDAFLKEFRFAGHLFCFIHLRSNVKNELHRRGFPESEVSEIVNDIFGKQVGTTYCEGLVDAENEAVFNQKLEEREVDWRSREERVPGCLSGFYDWFCEHKVDSIVAGMIKPVREEAGLGMPPSIFTTNASESLNAMLKRKVNFKKNELPEFVSLLKELIDEQERELERAVIGRGKYQFRKEFSFLEVTEANWFRMSREQREKHLKKVSQTTVPFTDASLGGCSSVGQIQLPVSAKEFHPGLKIPLASVEGIWKKASELLSNPAAISSAPGYDPECKMVASRTGKRPHLVTKDKGGRFSCDSDCPNWKSLGLCSHSVAVAHVNGQLEQFCDSYRKSKQLPSITQLVLTGLPGGVGRKGNRITRKRKREEVTSRVPLTTSPSTSSNPPVMQATSSCTSLQSPQPSVSMARSGPPFQSVSVTPTPPLPPYIPGGPAIPQQSSLTPSVQWSGNIGNVHVHSPTQWASFPQYGTSMSSSFSGCSQSTNYAGTIPSAEFELCFRTGNISVCNGCRNQFNKHAVVPFDLCVRHQEWRQFTSPVSHSPDARFGNAYYHATLACINARWPSFFPGALRIPVDVSSRLQAEHKNYIYTQFGLSL